MWKSDQELFNIARRELFTAVVGDGEVKETAAAMSRMTAAVLQSPITDPSTKRRLT